MIGPSGVRKHFLVSFDGRFSFSITTKKKNICVLSLTTLRTATRSTKLLNLSPSQHSRGDSRSTTSGADDSAAEAEWRSAGNYCRVASPDDSSPRPCNSWPGLRPPRSHPSAFWQPGRGVRASHTQCKLPLTPEQCLLPWCWERSRRGNDERSPADARWRHTPPSCSSTGIHLWRRGRGGS